MHDLDAIGFVDHIVDKPTLEPLQKADYNSDWERQLLVDSALVPIYISKQISESDCESFMTDELVEYTATFYERSLIYHYFWSAWLEWHHEDLDTPYTTRRAGIHIFAPIYAQELEGPMRYPITALTAMLNIFRGYRDDWRDRLYDDGERRQAASTLDDCIKISQQLHNYSDNPDLNESFEYLSAALILMAQHESFAGKHEQGIDFPDISDNFNTENHPGTGDIRNAIAHANYRIDFDAAFETDEGKMIFELGDQEFSIHINWILTYIGKQLRLSFAISTGITLGLFHMAQRTGSDQFISVLSHVISFEIDPDRLH
jgi:hypothetical protein